MIRFYKKSEIGFSILWIIIYVIGSSCCSKFSEMVAINFLFEAIFHFLLACFFVFWIYKHKMATKYGLCKSPFSAKYFLYFIPLIVLVSINFWFGIKFETSILECILFIVSMLCVGFVEEIIFRGFLFKAMEKDNVKTAIIVSSITFGIGHIINLFNSEINVVSTICQVGYTIAIGFLFVIIFYRGQSLLPCIITHSLVNATSIFANYKSITTEIITSAITILIAIIYLLVIIKILPKNSNTTDIDNNNAKYQ